MASDGDMQALTRSDPPRIGIAPAIAVLAVFVALAVFHTWPLATGLGSLSRHDNADAELNEWAVAWNAHQLLTAPTRLFDANIFYPEPNTLAFSEHLLLQTSFGAPLLWLGLPTLVVHNLLLLVGFALTGWTMALVIRFWTLDWWAAVLAGMLLSFNAHTLTRLAHLQAVHVEFLPIAVLLLDRVLSRPRVVTALRLALAFVLQALASNYLLVFMIFGLPAAALMRPREWLSRHRLRTVGLLFLAATVAAVLLSPVLLHYLHAHREQGFTRDLAEVAHYSASWRDYLAAGGRLHNEWWSARFARGSGAFLFPGITALLLTIVSFVTGRAWRPPARLWIGLGLAGLLLSLGTAVPGYRVLYAVVPPLQGIRAVVRFGYLLLVAVAALAAFGLAALRERVEHRPILRLGLSMAALVLVTVEAARVPLQYTPRYRVPPVYDTLRKIPDVVLVELPLYSLRRAPLNGDYMLNSTHHWHPILNGYSGFIPAVYWTHWQELHVFPDPSALEYLRRLGVTHVAVHLREFAELAGDDRLQRLTTTPGLTVFVRDANVVIYRLDSDRQ